MWLVVLGAWVAFNMIGIFACMRMAGNGSREEEEDEKILSTLINNPCGDESVDSKDEKGVRT